MGFYWQDENHTRVTAFDPDGPLPDGRAILPESILVP